MTERERLIELLEDYTEGLSARDLHKADFSEKFADYLLANGVIIPPCKVGDVVYVLITSHTSQGYIDKSEITGLIFGRNHDTLQFLDGSIYTIWDKKYEEHFGKTVFLTNEEAEVALNKKG